MRQKTYAIIGIAIPVLFWVTYITMSSTREEYSLFTKAVSELGSVDTPNKWIWNSIGYMLTGLLIAIYSVGLYRSMAIEKSSKWPLYGLMLSGVFMAISGVFPGDFDNRQSATMLLHSIGSFGSYVFFLIAAFTYPKLMMKTEFWRDVKWPTLIFTYLTIVFGAWPFVVPDIPSLGQKIVFFFYFAWIFYTAIKLYKQPQKIKG